jgi:hypothetical protein
MEAGVAVGVSMIAYPNPASALVNVEFNGNADENYTLRINDMAGRMMTIQQGVSSEGLNKVTLNLENVPSGFYLLEYETVNVRETLRMIVE